jgi:hypothetical protein
MKSMLLLVIAAALSSMEYTGLPQNIKVDENKILDWGKFSEFNIGYITRLTQNVGYLDAKVNYDSGKITVTPGQMFTINKIIVNNGGKSEMTCEMPASEINFKFLVILLPDFTLDRNIEPGKSTVSLVFNKK